MNNYITINIDGKKLHYITDSYDIDEDFISFTDIKGNEKIFSKKFIEEISIGENNGIKTN